MNPIDHGGVENRPRIYFGCVRSDYHDRLGTFTPPPKQPMQNPSMESCLLPVDSPLLPTLRDMRPWVQKRLPSEHLPGYQGAHAEWWLESEQRWAYNTKGPCGTMTRTPPCVFDFRCGVNYCRYLHESEIQAFMGLPSDFQSPLFVDHASRLKLM